MQLVQSRPPWVSSPVAQPRDHPLHVSVRLFIHSYTPRGSAVCQAPGGSGDVVVIKIDAASPVRITLTLNSKSKGGESHRVVLGT